MPHQLLPQDKVNPDLSPPPHPQPTDAHLSEDLPQPPPTLQGQTRLPLPAQTQTTTPSLPLQVDHVHPPEGQHQAQSEPIQTLNPASSSDLTPVVQSCAKCELPLQGSFVRALGGTFHLECFTCKDCGETVAERFFPRTEAGATFPLCERDYFRRQSLVCEACGGALRGSYITALGKKYHTEHFTCSVCPILLGPKDSYYEHDGGVFCHYHYSVLHASKCAGCSSAILRQFVEINRNNEDQHWHPECYMINKFWNVRLSDAPLDEDGTLLSPTSPFSPTSPLSPISAQPIAPEDLKQEQLLMEEKVYQIWTVLSAFEESSAGCISEMLLRVSNGSYFDGLQMAERFILHVEILFSAIDDLEAQMREYTDQNEFAHGREAKMLCKKIVNFFSLLSHSQETTGSRIGMTQELLSLVTGLAHYLKILIRIALTGALRLERRYQSTTAVAVFLNRLMELANREKCLQEIHGKGSIDAEGTSDLCLVCRVTIEDECLTFDHNHRWHPQCFNCTKCAGPLAALYKEASFEAQTGAILCEQCKTPESRTGFLPATKLEQYTFLLRVALTRLENLLHVKVKAMAEHDERGRSLEPTSTSDGHLSLGLNRKDSRSKSHSSDETRQYDTIQLDDIKRATSTHLDRKVSGPTHATRRQTVVEHQRPQVSFAEPANGQAAVNGEEGAVSKAPTGLQTEFIEEYIHLDESPGERQSAKNGESANAKKPATSPTISEVTEKLKISTGLGRKPSRKASQKIKAGRGSRLGSRTKDETADIAKVIPFRKRYMSDLSALELFTVKYLAVSILEPLVAEYFAVEELWDIIGGRKQTLWGRFVKGLRTEKKKPKAEGTFGVPLEVLVDRSGVESTYGAGPGHITLPSFVDESIAALRGMDMSVEGIFRKNGNIRRLKELSDMIDKDPASVSLTDENAVQVAALLKKFLREMPDPLLTFKLHRLFAVSQKMDNEATRKTVLHLAYCLLPKPNRESMEALGIFFQWAASFSHVDASSGSKMDLRNMATVIAPSILYSKSKDPIKDESFLTIEAVIGLLQYQEEFCMVPEDIAVMMRDEDLVASALGKGPVKGILADLGF